MSRIASVTRQTQETDIDLKLNLDGQGEFSCEAQVGFLKHMLHLLALHSSIDLELNASGDLEVDDHHLVEDVGLVLGQALREALGDKAGIERYGSSLLPMDEVLVAVGLDLGGRFTFCCDYAPVRERVGDLSTEMVPHFFRSLASEARVNLHFRLLNPGENEHHRIEAMFKGFARALRQAIKLNERSEAVVPSTKGQQ